MYRLRRTLIGLALLVFAAMPQIAVAQPIELKAAIFTSDRSMSFIAAVKPFIDAVNAEAASEIHIVLHSGGVLGREIAKQPQVVVDDVADMAFIVPGYSQEQFPDNAVIELPGLFRDTREGTLVYTQLIAANALRGYEDFFVVGAYVTEPETIHCRLPISTIGDLKGRKIRVNNPSEAAALEKLGAIPVLIQITQIANALSSGAIDCAAVSSTPLADYGVKRVASNHYLLKTSSAPLALVMNRKKFETLPPSAQNIIRKYSGRWAAERFIETYNASDNNVREQIDADPHRRVIVPSQSDLETMQAVCASVIEQWAGQAPRNRELLQTVQAELAKKRAEVRGGDAVTR